MMRIYRGNIYDVSSAVYPLDSKVSYTIMDVKNIPKNEDAFVLCGYNRELKVSNSARLIRNQKVIKIPFERSEGRLLFDLPKYFEEKQIRYKLLKRGNLACHETWDRIAYASSICKNGEIAWWSSPFGDYNEYGMNIDFFHNILRIDNKVVSNITVNRETNYLISNHMLEQFEALLQEKRDLSWKQFGRILENLNIHRDNPYLDIRFSDKTHISGNKVNWDKHF